MAKSDRWSSTRSSVAAAQQLLRRYDYEPGKIVATPPPNPQLEADWERLLRGLK